MRTKLLLSLLTTFLIGLIFSQPTFATFSLTAVECSGGITIGFCYEETPTRKLFELEGSQPELMESSTKAALISRVENLVTLLFEEIEIACQKTTQIGTITQTTPLGALPVVEIKGELRFIECAFASGTSPQIAEKCIIPTEFSALELKGTLKSVSQLLIKPEGRTTLFTIPFSNRAGITCPNEVRGEKPVLGEDILEILTPEIPEVTKTGENIASSGLSLELEPATLTVRLSLSFENSSGGEKLGDPVAIKSVL